MITSIILAAGESKRFKKGNKLLTTIRGKNFIEVLIKKIEKLSFIKEILVILGYNYDIIKKSLENKSVKILYNENYFKGLSTSIKFGILNSSYVDLAIFLADMPYINIDIIKNLYKFYIKGNCDFVRPIYKNKFIGFPVFVKKDSILSYLDNLKGDKGLSLILPFLKGKYFNTDDITVFKDVDKEEDLL